MVEPMSTAMAFSWLCISIAAYTSSTKAINSTATSGSTVTAAYARAASDSSGDIL